MKRILSFILCAILCLSCGTSVFAAEVDSSSIITHDETSTYELYQQAIEIAKARGLTLLPYEEAMATTTSYFSDMDTEVSYDYPGKYDLGENKCAGESEYVPTIETYARETPETAQPMTVSYGYVGSIDTPGEVEWYTFRVKGNGAHNIYSTGSTDVKVEFYKKTWYGSYQLIDSNDDGGQGLNFRLELGLEMNVDYYVKVSAYLNNTGSYVIWTEENVDELYSPTGGSWTWDVADPDPDGTFFTIHKLTYLQPHEAQAYYIMMTNDTLRKARDQLITMPYDAAKAFILSHASVTVAAADFILSHLLTVVLPSLTDLELGSLAEAAGMQSDGTFTRGVLVTSLSVVTTGYIPQTLNLFESWYGPYIYGRARYRGHFDIGDKKPLWK